MSSKLNVKRVAVIGAGPAGAIAVDALARENKFDTIRVFERREKAGGIWIWDGEQNFKIPSLKDILFQRADKSKSVPDKLPTNTPKDAIANSLERRYSYTPTYNTLESNIDARIMSYTEEPFPSTLSDASIRRHGPDSPYRHREIIRGWIESLLDRRGYKDFVSYSTTVEKVEKVKEEWIVTLRKAGDEKDYWWQETFDAVVVASGHYSVPFIPLIPGLVELEEKFPGTVEHSKSYRGPEKYEGKKVIVVGASVSATDVARDVASTVQAPVIAALRGPHPVFGYAAFEHPLISIKPQITRITLTEAGSTIHFADGTVTHNPDHIIFGTGYIFSLPFLPPEINVLDNRRLPGLYQHIWYQNDPTLSFIGAVSSGFTFRVFEYQAVAIARVLSGRASLPPLAQQQAWERKRLLLRGNGVPFYKVAPDFEECFEALREIAGPAAEGGRELVKWNPQWTEIFQEMFKRRLALWKREAQEAEEKLSGGEPKLRAKL